MGKDAVEVRKLSMLLLELIRVRLGLESGFFKRDELNRVQLMALNRYPPCPDPSLTLGLPWHGDVNLITVLLQGPVLGLQVLKDGRWLALQPLPDAFVINIGLALQVHLIPPDGPDLTSYDLLFKTLKRFKISLSFVSFCRLSTMGS